MKSRIISLLLAAAVLFSLAACGSTSAAPTPENPEQKNLPAETVSAETPAPTETPEAVPTPAEEKPVRGLAMLVGEEHDSTWNDALGKRIGSFRTGGVELAASEAAEYPALAAALKEACEKQSAALREYYDQLVADTSGMNEWSVYQVEETASVRRADTKVVSVLYSGSSYTGGAHGSAWYGGMSFYSDTGEKIQLEDLTPDVKALGSRVQKLLLEQYPDAYFYASAESEFAEEEQLAKIQFTVDLEGVTFYFGQYELAPYAEGMQIVTVPFYGNEDVLAEEFFPMAQHCVAQLTLDVPYLVDIDGDRRPERLLLQGWPNEYGVYEQFSVTVDDRKTETGCWSYHLTPMLFKLQEGKAALYVQTLQENDWQGLLGCELTVAGAEYMNPFSAAFPMTWDENRNIRSMMELPANENQLWLVSRMSLLGTVSGGRSYSFDQWCSLAADSPWFMLTRPAQLTLKQELKAPLVDIDTAETLGEYVTLPAGTPVEWFRTDGETLCDLRLQDGRAVRVKVNMDQWPYTANDVKLEELFDGILFAG
ncbi:MAG: DUF3298 and DUF4163 domain-containing protein [Oscillospiraceae bacterium]|nr:DUF3298 and DUF4163 domain-containing protein [Oscillospiraceae bacterium]